KMKSLLPQCFVPVRYAHLHCALGEEDNQQQQSTTMFKVPNLFQDLTYFSAQDFDGNKPGQCVFYIPHNNLCVFN
ncbi:MAG TPA: hypothetical protein VFC44_25805, partial [Candidatus Saccharimonadales bacterium]|nr:hypothetical protein [Candidatus Saccharimonadales bacterium]